LSVERLASSMGSYRKALARTLRALLERHNDVVVLDADTLRSTGSREAGRVDPERVVNVGISEQDLVGIAAGVAIEGLKPVVTGFGAFLMRAWEQVRNTIDRDSLNVKIVATHTGLSAHVDGSSHQVLEDIALMRSLARTAVFVPADEAATEETVTWLVEKYRGPAYVRLGRDNAFRVYERGDFKFRPGGLEVLRDPGDVTLIAAGPMVGVALEAARIIERGAGLRVGVVDMYSVKPAPRLKLERIARSTTTALFTVEEHRVIGGLGGAVAEALAGARGVPPLFFVGVPPGRYGASSRDYLSLLSYMGLDPESVARRVSRMVGVRLHG